MVTGAATALSPLEAGEVRVGPVARRGLLRRDWVVLVSGAFAMLTARPATGAPLTFFKLFFGASNATGASGFLLRVFDPANELVSSERRNVVPRLQCRRVRAQDVA